MLFGFVELLAPVEQLRVGVVSFGRIDNRDLGDQGLGLFKAAAEEPRRLDIVIEKVVQSFSVARVQFNRLFKILAGFRRETWGREYAGSFGTASVRPPKP